MVPEIYIGTILPEINRWQKEQPPTFRVSAYLDRFRSDGFDGMELWEDHIFRAAGDEYEAIAASDVPVKVFNTYTGFTPGDAERRRQVAEAIRHLQAEGVKYNLGDDPHQLTTYRTNLLRWANRLPPTCRLLCECHAGTVLEDPAKAAEFFASQEARYQVIVHPFGQPETLAGWFEMLGPRITHAHCQLRDGGSALRLREGRERVMENLTIMRDAGFMGSFTLEFTAGLGTDDEHPEASYRAALDDLEFLRGELGRLWCS